jgi:acetolactate synthase-1/3 small subunit
MKIESFQQYASHFSSQKLELLEKNEQSKKHRAKISLLVANGRGVMARLALVFSRRGVSILSIHTSTTFDQKYSNVLIRTADLERDKLKQVVKSLRNLIEVIDVQLWDETESKGMSGGETEEEICFLKIEVSSNDKPTVCGIIASSKARIIDFDDLSIKIKVNKAHPEFQTLSKVLSLYGQVSEICPK